jgi:hypothetical protein
MRKSMKINIEHVATVARVPATSRRSVSAARRHGQSAHNVIEVIENSLAYSGPEARLHV